MLLGALPQNHDAHILRRRRVERGDPVARARKDRLALGALLAQKLLERRHIGLLELAPDTPEPVGMQVDLGHAHGFTRAMRSEEHTSELQSLMHRSSAVFVLNKTKTS